MRSLAMISTSTILSISFSYTRPETIQLAMLKHIARSHQKLQKFQPLINCREDSYRGQRNNHNNPQSTSLFPSNTSMSFITEKLPAISGKEKDGQRSHLSGCFPFPQVIHSNGLENSSLNTVITK